MDVPNQNSHWKKVKNLITQILIIIGSQPIELMIEGNIPWIAKTPRDDFKSLPSGRHLRMPPLSPQSSLFDDEKYFGSWWPYTFEAGKSGVPTGASIPQSSRKALGATSQVPDSIPWSFLWTCKLIHRGLDSGHGDHARYFQDLYKVGITIPYSVLICSLDQAKSGHSRSKEHLPPNRVPEYC